MNRRSFVRKGLYVGMGSALAAQQPASLVHNARVHNIYLGGPPAAAHAIEERNLVKTTAEIDALIPIGGR